MFTLALRSAVARDPVTVEPVGLTAARRPDHAASRQVEPEEVEDATGHTGRVAGQDFIAHAVRLDTKGGEPLPRGRVVFVDGLDLAVDRLEVEPKFVP